MVKNNAILRRLEHKRYRDNQANKRCRSQNILKCYQLMAIVHVKQLLERKEKKQNIYFADLSYLNTSYKRVSLFFSLKR